MADVTALLAQLNAWCGGEVWFTERLQLGATVSRAQQTFRLARADHGAGTLHVTGRWGHDLSLVQRAITRIDLEPRAAVITERLATGVSRTNTFRLLALNDARRTGIGQVAHVEFHDSDTVRTLGATECGYFLDQLTRGSSSSEPREHARLRRQVVRSEHEPFSASRGALLKALRRWNSRPVVFWVGTSLREQLAFWWACHEAVSAGLTLDAWFAGPASSKFGLSVLSHEEHATLFGEAHPLSAAALHAFASKWRAFCSGRVPTMARVRHWPNAKRWALELPPSFFFPFPRRHRGALRLSALDQELLAPFAALKWATPFSIVRNDGWGDALRFLGDSGLLGRLRDWATLEGGRYLASRPAVGGARDWTATEYQLTAEGRAVLVEGVKSVSQLPAFPFGGFPHQLPGI